MISAQDITKKLLWRDPNYIADVVMWPNMIKTFFIWKKAAEVALFLDSWSIWGTLSNTVSNLRKDVSATSMMMMMNFFCCIFERQKAFSLISSLDLCQRSSPSQFSNTPWARFEPAQNLSLDLVEWRCEVMIITVLSLNFTVITLPNGWFSKDFRKLKQKQFLVQETSLSNCFLSLQVTQMQL